MNWATNIQSKIQQDAQQPLSILEDLVEDGCNFVDDFLSRFNSTQLAPTTELVKTPSRRHGSTRRTRAAIAAAQKSAKKIHQINEDVFNDKRDVSDGRERDAESVEQPKSPSLPAKSPSRLPITKKSVRMPQDEPSEHKSPNSPNLHKSSKSPPVNTFHKALLNIRDEKPEQNAQNNQNSQKSQNDTNDAAQVEEVLDEPEEILMQPQAQSQEEHKQKTSTDFTAPIRRDDDAKDKTKSPPRKSLAFASLPRRSPLKKSISTAKDSKDPSISRASWLSHSVKPGPNGLESERSSSIATVTSGKRKSDKMDESTVENGQSRKFNKSMSQEQQQPHQINEPKTPADALALKTAEIRKRLTQVAGTQKKTNLFDLPPKEAPVSLASEPIMQSEEDVKVSHSQRQSQSQLKPSQSHSQSQQSSVNAPSVPAVPIDESTTPPNSPPRKRAVDSWDSRMSANFPGAYPASDTGAEQKETSDEQEEEQEQEHEEEPIVEHATEQQQAPTPVPEAADLNQVDHMMPDDEAAQKHIEENENSHKSSVKHQDKDEPMDLSEITQQQKKQQEKEKAEEEDKSKNKRKHNTHEELEENDGDEEDQYRPNKQQATLKQPQPKPSLSVKPLQTTNKFRPRAGSTDNDKKNQFSNMLNSNVTQMGKSLNKKPSAVRMSSSTTGHQRMPSQVSVQLAQKDAAERVAAEKEKEKEKERKAAQRKEQEMRRVQAQKEAHEKQEAERRAQRDELAKRRREREEAAAAKKAQQQQERAQQQQERAQQQQKDRERAAAAASKKANEDESASRKLGTSTTGAVRPMHQRTPATRVSNAPVQRGLRPSASNGTLGYKAMNNAQSASTAVRDGKEKEKEAEAALPLPKPVPLLNNNASHNTESIELPDINSEYSDSEDDAPKNYDLPRWAESPNLKAQLQMQSTINPDEVFGMMRPLSMDDIFGVGQATNPNRHKFRARTSSANWSGADKLTPAEELAYAERMGFHGTTSKENNGKKK
ncbi:hypothetical protein E3P96_03080 [Wallemia ichthyophaga]|nr:hypothetical protein E3P96_03080 [Wallemia ichthyophaga]